MFEDKKTVKRPGEQRVSCPTFAVEDNVLLRRTDVCLDVQTVSFVQLAGQTLTWEESHRFHAAETRFQSQQFQTKEPFTEP